MAGVPFFKKPFWGGGSPDALLPKRHVFLHTPRCTWPDDWFRSGNPVGIEAVMPPVHWSDVQNYPGGLGYVHVAAVGSWAQWNLGYLKAGDWQLALFAMVGPEYGIGEVSVIADGAQIVLGQSDQYDENVYVPDEVGSSSDWLRPPTIFNFSLPEDADAAFRAEVVGTNAAWDPGWETPVFNVNVVALDWISE